MTRKTSVLSFLWLLLGVSTVWAQGTAAVSGTIKDQSGAVVPSAQVTVRNTETAQTRTAVSNDQGRYQVAALPVGAYEIRVERQGFKTAVQSNLLLAVAQEATVDVTLETGEISETVTVSSETPLLNTTSSSNSLVVGVQQMRDLPLNTRSWTGLTVL